MAGTTGNKKLKPDMDMKAKPEIWFLTRAAEEIIAMSKDEKQKLFEEVIGGMLMKNGD